MEPTDQTPRSKLFGRRKGHTLRKRQSSLLETQLARYSVDLSDSDTVEPAALFDEPQDDFWLEIGFGAAEHLLHQAQAYPHVGFFGCEVYLNGMAKAVVQIHDQNRSNIRLHHGDAVDLIERLPAASLGRIYLLYPDPWPKRRHWKRRFISSAMLNELARVLKPGAILRVATDIASYADWTLRHVTGHSDFQWLAETAADWRQPWPDWYSTRYEQKALKAGRQPAYLTFQRR